MDKYIVFILIIFLIFVICLSSKRYDNYTASDNKNDCYTEASVYCIGAEGPAFNACIASVMADLCGP